MAVLATTALVAVLGAGAVVGAAYLSAPGPLVVAKDGSGTYTTITEAVAAAEDGDTIRVRPGTYHESVTITKDITLDGDGDEAEDVVIEVDAQSPTYAAYWFGAGPYGIVIDESDATVRDLTVRLLEGAAAFTAKGGAPTIANVIADHVDEVDSNGASVYLHGDAVATVKDSELDGWVFVEERAVATIERNEVGRAIVVAPASGGGSFDVTATVRGNTARGIAAGSRVTIERNRIEGPSDGAIEWRGIAIEATSDDWIVRENTVVGSAIGIRVGRGSVGSVEGNVLIDNGTGISLTTSDATLARNDVRGGNVGISLDGGSAELADNTVEGANAGLSVGSGATPILTGNTICGNGRNLVVPDGVPPPDTEGNDICADGMSAG
jgi:parallel beta-helix repeat protein